MKKDSRQLVFFFAGLLGFAVLVALVFAVYRAEKAKIMDQVRYDIDNNTLYIGHPWPVSDQAVDRCVHKSSSDNNFKVACQEGSYFGGDLVTYRFELFDPHQRTRTAPNGHRLPSFKRMSYKVRLIENVHVAWFDND